MRCHICDKVLTPEEIKRNRKETRGGFDPCGVCMEVIDNVFEPLEDDELERVLDIDEIDPLEDFESFPS